jgi:molybdopterin molybdotransferase
MITIDAALDVVLAATRPLGAEEIALADALERVAAETVLAPIDLPLFANSAMDGYAVRADDLSVSPSTLSVIGEILAGSVLPLAVGPGQAAKIMTGAPLPEGADAVVPVELTRPASSKVTVGSTVTIKEGVAQGANVRLPGEDLESGAAVLEAGRLIGPADLGLLATLGMASVRVGRRPDVAVLATGSELVVAGAPLAAGQIPDANSVTACAQAALTGSRARPLGIASDDPDEMRDRFGQALQADVVISSGGVSVGEHDQVRQILEELGVERRFWGVKMKPGWPLALGTRGDTLVFSVPGNPVAAMVSFELFVRPALLALQGRRDVYRPCVVAAAAQRVKPTQQRPELVRCRLAPAGPKWSFETTATQGSSAALRSLALADGLALVPAAHPGSDAGGEFSVMLLSGSSPERPPFPG